MKTVKPSRARAFATELNLTAPCRNGQAPRCSRECPYGLDVRAFIRKLQRGSIRGAYGALSEQLTFPKVMCAICGAPCLKGCTAELSGAPVNLPTLEQAVFAGSKSSPPRYNVPPKEERIAVVGGGLGGLTCAYVLTTLGYSVELFEAENDIGGRLRELLPQEDYLPEIMSVIESESLTISTGRKIKSLNELESFSAVAIATGAGSDALGFEGKALPEKVFAAGEITGTSLPKAVESGKAAATAIDAYLKIGAGEEVTLSSGLKPISAEKTEKSEPLTKEQAQEEARRCRLCDCRACYDRCDLLQHYKTMPAKAESDVRVTLNPVDCFMPRRATRLINSCNDCGLCRDFCPESIDMNYMLMTSRALMFDDGSLPKVYHDIWLRDFEFSLSEKAAYLKKPENGYLFFPGCQLGASDPELVKDAYDLLCGIKPGSGIMLNCCGIPARWAGDAEGFKSHLEKLKGVWEDCGKPVIVTACPTCKRTFIEYLPDIPATSLYELLAEGCAPAESSGETVAVFHPCSSRKDGEMQESVKALIRSRGITANEISDPLERNRCCGYGGHIYPGNRELFDTMAQKRADSDPLPYVTYCANCRDVLSGKGKDCRHIIEVLTGRKRETSPPSLGQRRRNRVEVKAFYSGEEIPMDELKLIIPDELRNKMELDLIGDHDISDVIKSCNETKNYLLTERGTKIGHIKISKMTYWAEWSEEGDAFMIHNAYCHRMVLEGEGDGR
ncbi:MAG: NAD(P)-binding protein [Oscillospiraceae bacterium]|nr:NAD(P)-binding protein [Oscillospiraceae bacterium]